MKECKSDYIIAISSIGCSIGLLAVGVYWLIKGETPFAFALLTVEPLCIFTAFDSIGRIKRRKKYIRVIKLEENHK